MWIKLIRHAFWLFKFYQSITMKSRIQEKIKIKQISKGSIQSNGQGLVMLLTFTCWNWSFECNACHHCTRAWLIQFKLCSILSNVTRNCCIQVRFLYNEIRNIQEGTRSESFDLDIRPALIFMQNTKSLMENSSWINGL